MADRFLTREQVAEELHISASQAYALIRRGDLRSLKVGGRGLIRVGREDLEAYIERAYTETERWIRGHPFDEGGSDESGVNSAAGNHRSTVAHPTASTHTPSW